MKYFTLGLILLSANIYSATSATLHLTGTVPKKLDISIDVSTVSLDLTANKNDFKIATVTEKSNSNGGYKVNITSQNLGKLKREGGTEQFNYSLKYGGSSMALTSAAGGSQIVTASGVQSQAKDVLISYTGAAAETMVEGTYSDLLTLTISAN